MLDNLLLLSGNDIPFPEAQLVIHQPRIKEIAYIGEDSFFNGTHLLNFSKDMLSNQDNVNLEDIPNFEVLLSIMCDNSLELRVAKNNAMMVLTLLFPEYEIDISKHEMTFTKDGHLFKIDKNSFEKFKEILVDIFCLKDTSTPDYEPKGSKSRQIAEKLKERQRKLAELKGGDGQKVSILNRYISILSVGEQKDINELMNYTVYQLFEEFQRYELKVAFDFNMQCRMAGAQDVKDVDDWMKDLHS